ncbi:MAG: hypothetical protein R3248_14115 [Candidatus Promineifilaceae bacterium]|nr:hypothetical protein [Candidatus Promineifilaceae bacterium]
MPDQKEARAGRSRLGKAAERLYEDSRLRDALTDEEAQQLLSWAYHRLEQAATRAEEMSRKDLSGEAATPNFESQSDAVVSVVRRVNAIMDEYARTDSIESERLLASLVEDVDRAGERPAQAEDMLAAAMLVESPEELNRDGLFQRLMDLVTAGEGEEAE